MARQFDLLGDRSRFVAWDTAPPQAAIVFAWPDDLPPAVRDPELGLLVEGVALQFTASATVANRRPFLSLKTGSGAEYARVVAVAAVAASQARRVDFAIQAAGVANLQIRESLPEGLLLLPGYSLTLDVEGKQVGDSLSFVALRGRLVRP